MLQFTFNGFVTGSLYALLGVSFAFVLQITGRLHVAYVATYAIAPYIGIWLVRQSLPVGVSVAGGLAAAVLLGTLIERVVYRRVSSSALKRRTNPLIPIFVASLGLTIAVENAILLFYGAPPIAYNVISSKPVHLWRIGTTNMALITIAVCWALVLALAGMLRFTTVGRRIRAVGQNPVLAQVMGIRPDAIRITVFAITSVMAGVLGILSATSGGASPTMGFNDVFNAFVVAFLAGLERGPLAIALVALFLGQVTGGIGGRFYSQQLSPLVMFSILLAYLCAKSMQGTRQALALRSVTRRLRSLQRA